MFFNCKFATLVFFASLPGHVVLTAKPGKNLDTKCGSIAKLYALPGNGWCSLRDIELNPVFEITYDTCQKTNNGKWLIPDYLNLIPKSTSDVATSATIIDHYQNSTSATAKSISISASGSFGRFSGSGSFSSEYKQMKKDQVEDKTVTTRVIGRYVLHGARFDDYAVKIHPSLKMKLDDAAEALIAGNATRASLIFELTILTHGTHVIDAIDLGGAIIKDDYISKAYRSKYSDDQHSITVSASIGFSSFFNMQGSYSKSSFESRYTEYLQNVKTSHTKSFGGQLFIPGQNVSDWINSVPDYLVPVDRSGIPIYNIVTPRHFPQIPEHILRAMRSEWKQAIDHFYAVNLRKGCLAPESPNFDYNANVGDKTCQNPPTNYTFGGVYQICWCSGGICGNRCDPHQRTNFLSGGQSCPTGYTAILLQSSSTSSCYQIWWFWTVCETLTIDSYWCAAINHTVSRNSGVMFGGLYSSTSNNPLTSSKECPPYHTKVSILADLTICISSEYELGYKYSVPFGGFFSCRNGNPLGMVTGMTTATGFSSKQTQDSKSTCAEGYSQHTAVIDHDCIINYCVKANSFGNGFVELPINLPPFQDYNVLFKERWVSSGERMTGSTVTNIVLGILLGLVIASLLIVAIVWKVKKVRAGKAYSTVGDDTSRPLLPREEEYQQLTQEFNING